MFLEELKLQIGNIDIYLLDQILKNRYHENEIILDAGCGSGRNLKWFINNYITVFGIDANAKNIIDVKKSYPKFSSNFSIQNIEDLSFSTNFFNHIICNAVLHFAKNEEHFFSMFSSLISVLKPKGTLFIRMTSSFGLENKIVLIKGGKYKLPDGTNRFLLTETILNKILSKYNCSFIEPVKTVNVENIRCMTTLVLQKKYLLI